MVTMDRTELLLIKYLYQTEVHDVLEVLKSFSRLCSIYCVCVKMYICMYVCVESSLRLSSICSLCLSLCIALTLFPCPSRLCLNVATTSCLNTLNSAAVCLLLVLVVVVKFATGNSVLAFSRHATRAVLPVAKQPPSYSPTISF